MHITIFNPSPVFCPNPHFQCVLLPQHIDLLPLPSPLLALALDIEIPHQSRQYQPNLHISKLHPNAIPGPYRKRIERIIPHALVPIVAKPTARIEFLRVTEVSCGAIRRVERSGDVSTCGEEMPGYCPSPWRHEARKADSDGNAKTETFFDDGAKVGEFVDAVGCYFRFVAKSGADFSHEFCEDGSVGAFEEVVHRSREGGCGRFAAGEDEHVERGFDFGDGHAFGVVVAEDVGHEVWFLRYCRREGEAVVDFGLGHGEVVDEVLGDLAREEFPQEALGEGEVAAADEEGGRFEVGEEDRDPGVVLGLFEAVEGFAEAEVADYVKGGEVEPFDDVDDGGAGGGGG